MLATILVTVVAGCTQGALTAAVQGAVPNLVADEELARANSLSGAFKSAGYMLGPGIGGALLAVTSAPGVFAVSALMMAVSALLMVGIRRRSTRIATKRSAAAWTASASSWPIAGCDA